jgi:protein SCO1
MKPSNLPEIPVASDYVPTNKHSTVLWFCAIVMVLGMVIFWQYLVKVRTDAAKMKDRPGYVTALKENLEATEMSGQTVNIGQLEGKVWVAGFIYTLCPRGCAGLAAEMKKLQDEFSSNPKFHLVSVSLNAEVDTPEHLKSWVGNLKYDTKNWWFLTGDGPKLRGYMKDQFKLPLRELPKSEQKTEFDIWEHKLALVLVDSKLRIRGTYDFSNFDNADLFGEKLRADLKEVLKEADNPELGK